MQIPPQNITSINIIILISDSVPIVLVREDTILQKVFLKPLNTTLEDLDVRTTGEFVYMDYNLQLNDTIEIPLTYHYGYNINTPDISKHIVDSVDSVLMNNIWHKTFYMHVVSGFEFGGQYKWIEGIGCSTTGPIITPIHPSSGIINKIICFQNNGTFPIANWSECDNSIGIENVIFSQALKSQIVLFSKKNKAKS